MEIAGYVATIVIGISLGLIGGGGSILTVPVLVYLFRINPVMATAYSLFIVGATSFAGAISKYRSGLVDIKTAMIFGIPSIAAVYATRKFIMPAIPDIIFTLNGFEFSKPLLTMLLFAILMVAASISMIKKTKVIAAPDEPQEISYNYPYIIAEGLVVGTLTGLVGAGGGFLIIPALVLFSKLPMKMAVGTSLLIIAAKSLIGFLGDLGHFEMDWMMLMIVTALAIGGIFIGNIISRKMHADRLKKGFGWFILIMGVYIILNELFIHPAA